MPQGCLEEHPGAQEAPTTGQACASRRNLGQGLGRSQVAVARDANIRRGLAAGRKESRLGSPDNRNLVRRDLAEVRGQGKRAAANPGNRVEGGPPAGVRQAVPRPLEARPTALLADHPKAHPAVRR